MKLPIYQIDAFSDKVFQGNPAAVCPLDCWLSDEVMQLIAAENNLSETAFFVPTNDGFHIRWFTPVSEVDLCGHATLASAYVLYRELGYTGDVIKFDSKSGPLFVERSGDLLTMDFPAQPAQVCDTPEAILKAFGQTPIACLKSEDYVVIFEDETFVRTVTPDLNALRALDLRGVAVSSVAKDYDFVVRFFAPKYGIDEDPVTGSAYTQLMPYWSEQLGKAKLSAMQGGRRTGKVICELCGDRVKISGSAVKFLSGTIEYSF